MLGKRKTRLTTDGAYYLIIMGFLLAGALLREINLLLAVFALMAAGFFAQWRHCVASLGRLSVRRRLPDRVAAGEPLTVEVVANNGQRRRTSWGVVVADRLRRDGGRDRDRDPLAVKVVFPRLAAGSDAVQTYQATLTRRGRYLFDSLTASTRFPFGLLRRTVTLSAPQSLLVVPRQGRLTERWRQRERMLAQGARQSRQRPGASGDFHSLRPYRPGDSRHLIHWRTSARQNQWMVRQFERQETRDLAVLLDLWQGAEPRPRELETVELAVSLAATLLADRCQQGGMRLVLGIAGAEPRFVAGAASGALFDEMLEALALAEASPTAVLTSVLERGLGELPTAADGVLISTREDRWANELALSVSPRAAGATERMLLVSAAGDELREYFEP